ncbi:MAG: 2-amino-4-hydroxy-6-hydroxymethyldihydropteridine diphosphokinase [Treponema sp.]|nr:2-amino-4-hydroxy-6-hydroxymethyldihydropteridine diphosphokinase [Treponema sp.]
MIFVILGVGSNRSWQGNDKLKLLRLAFDKLGAVLSELKCSSVYRTKPMYVEDQDDFYNMAVCGYAEDDVSPFDLLKSVNKIEAELGRNRKKEIRNGPRSIDIDIEIFGGRQINTKNLQIPHPRIKERAFVLVPALEILGQSADSNIRQTFAEYLLEIDSSGVQKVCESRDFINIEV